MKVPRGEARGNGMERRETQGWREARVRRKGREGREIGIWNAPREE